MSSNTKENVENIQCHIDEIMKHLTPFNGSLWVKITVEYGDYERKNVTELQYENSVDWDENVTGKLSSAKWKTLHKV